MKRLVSMICLILALGLVLTGCSSGNNDPAANASVKIAVTLPYVVEGAADEFSSQLKAGLPALNTAEKSILVQSVNTGDAKSDPMSTMAGMTKITTMFLGKEIEIMICDAENAQRHGEGGNAYMPLDKLFTEDELTELGVSGLTVNKVDGEGNLTGETSVPVGISLEACESVKNIFKMSDLGLYVIDMPESEANIENIRAAVRFILTMK